MGGDSFANAQVSGASLELPAAKDLLESEEY